MNFGTEESRAKYGKLFLRVGLALTVLWSVKTKLTTPDKVAGMMGALGLSFASAGLVIALGVVLAVVAVWLISGYQVKYPAAFLAAFFIGTVVLGALKGFTVGPAIWKDIGLLGASMALVLT